MRLPLQDVHRHVELWFIGAWRTDQFALCVSRNYGAVCQGESVQWAEGMAVLQYCIQTEKKTGCRLKKPAVIFDHKM